MIESDQESGLISEEAKLYLQRVGTELKEKGVNAHARLVEKHHDILRVTYFKIVLQAAEEGIQVTEEQALSLAITAKNSLFTVGNSTPMQAVFGRQSPLLPNLDTSPAGLEDESGGTDGHSRGRHRLREWAVQSMVEATAQNRIRRALNTKTRGAVQAQQYTPGDDVEFWRAPAQKEMQGWRGPGNIVHVEGDGTIHVKWQGGVVICRNQDVRRALMYFSVAMLHLLEQHPDHPQTPYDYVHNYLDNMQIGTTELHAIIFNHGHVMSDAARQRPRVMQALLQVAACHLHLTGCIGRRLARGTHRLDALPDIHDSFIMWWRHHKPNDVNYLRTTASRTIHTRHLHNEVQQQCVVQFLLRDSAEIARLRRAFPQAQHLGGAIERDDVTAIPVDPGPLLDPDQRTRSRSDAGSAGSGNPREHIARRLPDSPPASPRTPAIVRQRSDSGSENPRENIARCMSPSPSSSSRPSGTASTTTTELPDITTDADPTTTNVDSTTINTITPSNNDSNNNVDNTPHEDHDDDSDTDLFQDNTINHYDDIAHYLAASTMESSNQDHADEIYLSDHVLREPPSQIRLEDLEKDISNNSNNFQTDQQSTVNNNNNYYYGDPHEVEMILSPSLAHWSIHCDRQLQDNEELIFTVNKERVSAVTRRSFDNLTPIEIKQHWPAVEAAMLDELRRWYDLKVFTRQTCKESENIVDGTWVLKWKSVKTKLADGSEATSRIVKARLTARGFKDMQATQECIATFAGTATKPAQRMVCAFAAQHEYTLPSMDISAAFPKGMTFTEIAAATGQPLRSVQFEMPKNSAHLLKRLPRMENFDPIKEVLHFVKAMWGLKDAPRAFGLRRDQTLRESGARPTCRDPQLWVKHAAVENKLHTVAMFSTHMDDITGGSATDERTHLEQLLKRDFGNDLKVNLETFEFTGVEHVQDPVTKSIWTHQEHYVQELSVIPLDDKDTTDGESKATETESEAFRSLLGALMWLLATRADISPYVGYLQRQAQAPKRQHLIMINKIRRYCKKTTTGLWFKRLPRPMRIVVVADSAYQANEAKTECLSMRGYFVSLRCDRLENNEDHPGGHVQCLEHVSKKLQVISRSAFAAELRNALEAAQDGVNFAVQLHETYHAAMTPEECARLRNSASYTIPVTLVIDNYGLFSATSKVDPSPGSDASMIFHVKALRYLLDNHNIKNLTWADNRDMIADGLTKVKVSRDDTNIMMTTGQWLLQHPHETWTTSRPRSST